MIHNYTCEQQKVIATWTIILNSLFTGVDNKNTLIAYENL